MRLATWNIGGGFVSTGEKLVFDLENLGYFIDELQKIQPDVVCFQEIHVSRNNDQPKLISEALNLPFIRTESIAGSHIKDGEMLSIAILSKYPITSSKFHTLPNPYLQFIWKGEMVVSHDKGFLEVEIDYSGTSIRILSGHMVPFRKFGRDFLADEFKEIRDEIERVINDKKMPTIVGADMNFGGDILALIPRVFSEGFHSVLADVPTTPKDRKYDKILISEDWTYTDSQILHGKADHYLCFADVEL